MVSRHPLEDLSDLGFEPHVQHPVCLVKDDVEDLGEVDLVGVEEIVEPSRGGDEDGGTGLDVPQLLTLGGASVGAGRTAGGQVWLQTLYLDFSFQLSILFYSSKNYFPSFRFERAQRGKCSCYEGGW